MKCRIDQIKPPFIIFIVTLIGLQICFSKHSYAQTFTFNNDIKKSTIPFKKVKNLIIIPLYINGKGPFNFLLDTGVDPLIITDLNLIDTLGIKDVREVKINGMGSGDEISALFSPHPTVRIGQSTIANIPTVILKKDVFNLSAYLGLEISGLIGYYFFNSFIVKINYNTERITYWLPEKKKRIRGTKMDLELLENKPYINTVLKSKSLGEIPVKLVIDCGANHALSLEMYENNPFPIPEPNISANLGIGLSGEISGNIGRVSSLKLGINTMKDVITSFPDFNDVAAKIKLKSRNGNLGAGILKNFHVTFDYKDKAIYFKKNDAYGSPFEHDMSGLEIYAYNGEFNRFFVSRIEAGSPGEKSDFKFNDEILSVNFKSAASYTLDELTNLLKSENGRTVIIEIVRNNNVIIKLLTLKRRI